jgi:hypothetical protein
MGQDSVAYMRVDSPGERCDVGDGDVPLIGVKACGFAGEAELERPVGKRLKLQVALGVPLHPGRSPLQLASEEEKFDVLRDAEPQNDRQLLGRVDVCPRNMGLVLPLIHDRLQSRHERGALGGREIATAVIGVIEERFERGGDITPGASSAEATHLGESEPLSFRQLLPESGEAAVGPTDVGTAGVSVSREQSQPHVVLPWSSIRKDRWEAVTPATEMIQGGWCDDGV